MSDRITDKDVLAAFSFACGAARQAGLKVNSWALIPGTPSLGINYGLVTGRNGSHSVATNPFGSLGKTARPAYEALTWMARAWRAVPPRQVDQTWPETNAEKAEFSSWQYEVSNGDTLLGFRDWLNREDIS